MDKKLEIALNNVEMTYQELIEIGNNILDPILSPVNDLIDELSSIVNVISIDQIRDYILRLQLKAFEISEIKEKSTLKADLATALQKEAFAVSFNSLDGSAAVKEKLALVATSSEVIAQTLYALMANLLKTKVDQIHRMVDSLKSILMSRMQEFKFMNIGTDNNIPQTLGNKFVGPNGGTTKLHE